MSRIAITGIAGFIGFHLTNKLVDEAEFIILSFKTLYIFQKNVNNFENSTQLTQEFNVILS